MLRARPALNTYGHWHPLSATLSLLVQLLTDASTLTPVPQEATHTMGEAADYENMAAEMHDATEDARAIAKMNEMQAVKLREAEFANLPANWWQPGCPFRLKDIVYDMDANDEAKVIGLPTIDDVTNCNKEVLGKVWVHYTPRASHLTPHASRLTPHASRLTPGMVALHGRHTRLGGVEGL